MLGMLLEQQGDHCGWSGVSRWGSDEGHSGRQKQVLEALPTVLRLCSHREHGGGDLFMFLKDPRDCCRKETVGEAGKAGSRQTTWEGSVEVRARNDCSLGQCDCRRHGATGWIQKVRCVGGAHESDVGAG